MEIKTCDIEGLLIISPKIFEDERGYFFESFSDKKIKELTGLSLHFVQDNESKSNKNVLRGLHFQKPPFDQGKLVRVIKGKVLDVAVDIRQNSPTYGKYFSIELTEENKTMLWIPPGFAHGFSTMENNTIFSYKCTNYYSPDYEGCILWNDPVIAINWKNTSPIISEKDKLGQEFINFVSPF